MTAAGLSGLVIIAIAVSAGMCQADPQAAKARRENVFELQLQTGDRFRATASLRNLSTTPQWALVDSNVQAAHPALRAADGANVPLQDSRATTKFDNTPYASLFTRVPAGGEVRAGEGGFVRQPDGRYVFEWETFTSDAVSAGCYQLSVTWRSAIAGWNNERKEWVPRADVWQGTVTSAPQKICLP